MQLLDMHTDEKNIADISSHFVAQSAAGDEDDERMRTPGPRARKRMAQRKAQE
jgi:hypothetical protein